MCSFALLSKFFSGRELKVIANCMIYRICLYPFVSSVNRKSFRNSYVQSSNDHQ